MDLYEQAFRAIMAEVNFGHVTQVDVYLDYETNQEPRWKLRVYHIDGGDVRRALRDRDLDLLLEYTVGRGIKFVWDLRRSIPPGWQCYLWSLPDDQEEVSGA